MNELRSERTAKTKKWTIRANRDRFLLGEIFWNGKWRQYIFVPNCGVQTVWSAGCLDDVSSFLIEQNKKQRMKK